MEHLKSITVSVLLLLSISNEAFSQPETLSGLPEGDIVLTPEQQSAIEVEANSRSSNGPQNAVVRNMMSLWRDQTLVYVLDPSLSQTARTAIETAMADYTTMSCIKFRERTTEADYVRIFAGNGCFSYIGRVGGPQDMSIGRGCEFKGIVMHEIFHALGRWHEQSRPDRDMYVTINRDNIQSGFESNFNILSSAIATTQGVEYDFDSIMHYRANAFTRNGLNTIEPINPNIPISRLGQRNGFSSRDMQHVNTLYCESAGTWSGWSQWTTCSRTCNGGSQTRTRTCIGGSGCGGSNIASRECNTQTCVIPATWGAWSSWSICSATCATGRRSRIRTCQNGNTCPGLTTEFENCNNGNCPGDPTWATWSSWSDCSQTCQGGLQRRTRRCLNGSPGDCPGFSSQDQLCNNGTKCGDTSGWTECTKTCGGGMQWRGNGTGSESRECNTIPCHNEPCIQGLSYHGCYRVPPPGQITFLEDTNILLDDDPYNRSEPIRKCGQVANQRGYRYFGIALGLCYSGPHPVDRYQTDGQSILCQNGTGSFFGYFAMDVYEISDRDLFFETSSSAGNCGLLYCMNNTLNADLCSGATSSLALTSLISISLIALLTTLLSI